MDTASCRCFWGLLLKFHVQYASEDTVAAAAIPRPIRLAGCFFVCCSSAGDGYGATKSSIAVPPSGTLSTFYRPSCLILSSRISTSVALAVPHIWLRFYPLPPSSSCIYLFCPHFLTSLPYLCCCCLNRITSPPKYLIPFLSTTPVISHFCFLCNYHPDSPLYISFDFIHIITHLFLRHTCYPTSLPLLLYCFIHCPMSLVLPYPSLRTSSASISKIPLLYFWFNQLSTSPSPSLPMFLITVCLWICHLHQLMYLILLSLLSHFPDADSDRYLPIISLLSQFFDNIIIVSNILHTQSSMFISDTKIIFLQLLRPYRHHLSSYHISTPTSVISHLLCCHWYHFT